MSIIGDYLASCEPSQQEALGRVIDIARGEVPGATEGVSYGLPCLMHNGWPFISVVAGKSFLSLYPFSGKVGEALGSRLDGFEATPGSIHFSEEKPLPDDLVREIVRLRLAEIAGKKPR